MTTDHQALASSDMGDLLDAVDRVIEGPRLETKGGPPARAADDPLATVVGAMDRQTAAIVAATKARPAPSPAAPAASAVRVAAEVRQRVEKARALRELRETSQANARPRGRDPLHEQKMARINAAMDQRDADDRAAELARLRRENADLRRKSARPPGPSGHVSGRPGLSTRNAAFALYRKAISHYLRTGQETIDGRHLKELQAACIKLDEKAFNASVNAEGGYFVQPEHDTGPMERLMELLSPMRQLATVRSISAASFKSLHNLGGQQARWVGEETTTTTDETPRFAELEFPAMTLLAEPAVTQEALEDGAIDVEQFLSEEAQYKFAESESIAYIGGSGVRTPKGILSQDFVADGSWAWGKVGYLATGADGALATAAPADVLVKLPLALRAQYRQTATWLMNRHTIGTVRTVKDDQGRYIWGEGDVSKQIPNTLAGYVVHEDEQMPSIASNAHALAFGDWKRAYLIVDRIGFQAFRNPYLKPPYVIFHMRKRVGGGVRNFEAYKTIKFGVS